jgi:cytochrome oxidase Cu insertion factor (SCO1/SenC/PrrC family)
MYLHAPLILWTNPMLSKLMKQRIELLTEFFFSSELQNEENMSFANFDHFEEVYRRINHGSIAERVNHERRTQLIAKELRQLSIAREYYFFSASAFL